MLTVKHSPAKNLLAMLLLALMACTAIMATPVLPDDDQESLKKYVYISSNGKVKIKFPEEYKVEVSPGDGHTTTKITASAGETHYFLSYTIHETPMTSHYEMASLSLESFSEKLGVRTLSANDYLYKSHRGRMAEMLFEDQGIRIFYRAILVGQIQYQLIVTQPEDMPDRGSVDQFFKSFKLMK